MPITFKLKEIFKELDVLQQELARMTKLRLKTISKLCSEVKEIGLIITG